MNKIEVGNALLEFVEDFISDIKFSIVNYQAYSALGTVVPRLSDPLSTREQSKFIESAWHRFCATSRAGAIQQEFKDKINDAFTEYVNSKEFKSSISLELKVD